MQNFALKLFPREIVRYDFINRDHREFPEGFNKLLRQAVDTMSDLALTQDEYDFIRSKCYYIDQSYVDFLKGYRFNPEEVIISQDGPNLKVRVEGPWYRTILWEVPLMAIISELYFDTTQPYLQIDPERTKNINESKARTFFDNNIHFADFGTRRRYSFENHEIVIQAMQKASSSFVGTSNMHFAHKYNLTPVGTEAHELFSLMASIYGFNMANHMGMEKWAEVYQGDLGTVLPDTFTTDVFLKSFNTKFAKLYDGVRQDSGDPIAFADKIIKHYKSLRIDPESKAIVFSDALDTTKVLKIASFCRGKIKMSFGIGTFLTNDIPDVKPLNIVIKLIGRKVGDMWMPTVKLSDNPGKHTGDPEMIDLCKKTLMIKD